MSSDPKSPDAKFGRIAVLGLGAMGGSFCRAVVSADAASEVVGWSPEAAERAAAVAAGALGQSGERWQDVVKGADLVVLAMPLGATLEVLSALSDHIGAEVTIMDVASLKAPVARAADAAGLGGHWVGSHPMVGSERSGFAASDEVGYEGALVWIVADHAAEDRTTRVEALWARLGAGTRRIDATAHDHAMVWSSHLPQLASTALASVLANQGVSPAELGPGGLDMTRLAASGPEMWADILAHAPPELAQALGSLAAELAALSDRVERGALTEIAEAMERTRAWKADA